MRRWNPTDESALSRYSGAAISTVSGLSSETKPSGHSRCTQYARLDDGRQVGDRLHGIRHGVLRDVRGAGAVLPVARDEGALVAVEVRDHDPHRHDEVGAGQRREDQRPQRALAEREVQPHEGDDERYGLFAGGGQDEERRRPQPPALLDVQEGPQQKRRGQRHGVELVEHEEAQGGVEQVGAGEQAAGTRVTQDPRAQAVRRPGARRHDRRLQHQQHRGARPHQPRQREQGEDRVDVRAQTRHLPRLQLAGGDLEEVAVRRVVHGLDHVAEVEACVHVGAVLEPGQQAVHRGEEDHRRGSRRRPRSAPAGASPPLPARPPGRA